MAFWVIPLDFFTPEYHVLVLDLGNVTVVFCISETFCVVCNYVSVGSWKGTVFFGYFIGRKGLAIRSLQMTPSISIGHVYWICIHIYIYIYVYNMVYIYTYV